MQRSPRLAYPAGTAVAAGSRAGQTGAVRLGLAGLACFAAALSNAALAATPVAPLAESAAITQPTPRDAPYPGLITLAVDATDLDHRVLRMQQTLPVARAGRLTLLYPRWLPGTHGPYGDVDRLTGLQVRAGDRLVPWQRDLVDPFAFHVDVPAGVAALTLSFEHLSPTEKGQGRVSMSRSLLGVQWNQTVLYPAGHYASAIRVEARVKLPGGWQQASALRAADGAVAQAGSDGWTRFAPVSLETLVDSPLFAGPHVKRIELDPPGTPRAVALNLLADDPAKLEASAAQLDAHKALVQQADKLYGSRPWRHYDFLLALSNNFGGIGLEHHESSENGVHDNYFKDWDKAIRARTLLPHEYTHAWNGKFRRPAELWTPQYNVPMRNPLLWVYEGMTQYWGQVLTARSGLATPEQSRDALAQLAAYLDARGGRTWRSLQDTTTEGTLASQRDKIWRDWQRGADYYDEAVLLWLDADTLIREKSNAAKSLDDFARAFFGPTMQPHADGSPRSMTYSFDDVVKTLNSVQPHDWASFLRTRLDRTGPGAPLEGLARAGWKIGWAETESEFAKNAEGRSGKSGRERPDNFMFSLGLQIDGDGELDQVMWNSPAFQAGAAPGQKLVAVNMQAYKAERLAAAISANKTGTAPIELLVKDGDHFKLMRIDWRGGLRYPRLERVDGTPDRLAAIWGGAMSTVAAIRRGVLGLAAAALLGPAAQAHETPATTAPVPASVLSSWPGTMTLAVDATDLDRRVLRIQQTLPVAAPGQRLALRYARYLPGSHGPYGDVTRLAGLVIQAGAQRLPWQRDAADPFTFLVDVPAGVASLGLSFQYLAPVRGSGERISVTREMLGLEWENVLLYPAGAPVHAIRVQPRLKLPPQWQQVSALRGTSGAVVQPNAEGWVDFAPMSVETLVDSPLFAGRHLKAVPLDAPGATHPVTLTVVADEASALEASKTQLEAHRALVHQADKLFGGARHFRHYDLMLVLSEELGGLGLEHHESSENVLRPDYFKDWDKAIRGRELLPHEYVHSWNGKHRRPAELATPDYHQPMGNHLLWAYEGLTEYWGHVLAARSGLSTPEQARDRLANVYAEVAARSGRSWRPLQDTVNDPAIGPGPTREWSEWQRSSDYYDEAQLVWLDVDLTLRALSHDRRSLDDLARSFFGGSTQHRPDGSIGPSTYTEDDLLAALNAVHPHDWRRFLHDRLDRIGAPTPGLAHSGWRLAWSGEESSFESNERGWEGSSGTERPQNLVHSLGLRVIGDGSITEVFWNSPAFDAGLTQGMTLLAVNDRAYKAERIEAALRANTGGQAPLRLLVKDGELYRSVTIDWRGGVRYPRLERVDGTVDRLSKVWKAR